MFTVYTKSNCSFCVAAKKLLDDQGLVYTEINVENDSARRAWLRLNGKTTYPQIVIMDGDIKFKKWVGGYDDLMDHLIS